MGTDFQDSKKGGKIEEVKWKLTIGQEVQLLVQGRCSIYSRQGQAETVFFSGVI